MRYVQRGDVAISDYLLLLPTGPYIGSMLEPESTLRPARKDLLDVRMAVVHVDTPSHAASPER